MKFNKWFKLRSKVNTTGIAVKPVSANHSSIGKIQHTIKFGSIFAPDSLRGINLLFRSSSNYNSLLVNKPSRKILVKQSYIFMVWVNYLCNKKFTNDRDSSVAKSPAFFIYPRKNYKTTITKAPMAHKTYSQEQFMIRFYNFSITFHSDYVGGGYGSLNSVNKSSYFASFLKRAIPVTGTNMLFVSKYSLVFGSKDSSFFSLAGFSKFGSKSSLV
jgi:hypothetical protein